jgi:hypothetical protein
MRPTIGRVVHFAAPVDCGGQIYPAMVTRVAIDGQTLDLVTFGPDSIYFQHAVRPREGDGGGWFWPERV